MKPQQTAPIWDTHYTWKCRKHIPVPLTCPAFFEQCPSCKQLRPSESLRPSRIPEAVKPGAVKPEAVKTTVKVKTKHLTLVAAPEPVAVVEPKKAKPKKAEPKKATPGKVHCPGPKCRKQARSTSPYCSKICSDRCLRLRKKFNRSILSEAEVKNLNVILAALDQWAGSSDDNKG